MEFLEAYRGRMSTKDNNVRDRKVAEARSRAIKHFEQDPSFFTVNGLEPDNSEIVVKRMRVINESVLKQLNPERVYSKYIVPHPEEHMIAGTMLFGLYDVDWIVTAVTGLGDVHQQATLQKLNEFITIRGIDQTIPAVVNGVSRLGDGVLETNLITMPDELVKIRVQDNATTRGIERDARMKIANKMYTLTKVDIYTDDGVINWIAKEDLKEHEDENPTPTPAPEPDEIIGEDTITRARNYTYTAPGPVESWSIIGAAPDVVKVTKLTETTAVVRAEKTQFITFELVANMVEGEDISKFIRLVSLL